MYYSKKQVLSVLDKVYNDSRCVLYGEQCGGGRQLPSEMLEKYAKATGGKQPAVLGIDLACYGLQLPEVGVGTETWNRMIADLKDYASKGGIITASSHFANPTGRWTPVGKCRGPLGGEDAWEELLTDGTEYNKIVKEELRIDGLFLKELDSAGIPVLWRPLHECNGGWFWFCGKTPDGTYIDPSYMKHFWKMIYDMYTVEMGMKNLIWVYGPNVANGEWIKPAMYYYPGDEMCDMVGIDWYTNSKNEINYPDHSYDRLMATGKIAAITEFGTGDRLRDATTEGQEKLFNALDMLALMKNLQTKGLKIAYVLTWCGSCGSIGFLGKAEEAVRDPFVITLDRLVKMYE